MKGIPIAQRTDAELEAIYRRETSIKRRDYRQRRAAIAQFRASAAHALTYLPGMPERAEALLSAAIEQFDKEMSHASLERPL